MKNNQQRKQKPPTGGIINKKGLKKMKKMEMEKALEKALEEVKNFRPDRKETLSRTEWEKIANYILTGPAKKLLDKKLENLSEILRCLAQKKEKDRDSLIDFCVSGPGKYFIDKNKVYAVNVLYEFSMLSTFEERKSAADFCKRFYDPHDINSTFLLGKNNPYE